MPDETAPIPERVAALLGPHGLILRGGFNVTPDDAAPAVSLLLVGHGGAPHWPHFLRWRKANPDVADPLDTWSRIVIDGVAARVGARAAYPNDRPYLPFQRWAMRAEGLSPSPPGLLIHPEFGLWHAWRGALLFDVEIPIQVPVKQNHPCAPCAGKPCLNSCPADAISVAGFDAAACRAHVASDAGHACRQSGCIARNACPVGVAHRYPAGVQAFHMAAFLRG